MQSRSSKEQSGTVRDQQGRQRFHGAFTGGFSAGYFNTVGSAEGFKPAQFVSSRSNRAAPKQRSAKDYMDEEDGLLGGSLLTKQELDSFKEEGSAKDAKQATLSASDRIIMEHFILKPSNTIGKKLLSQLGWKPGIAIGPRRKKKVDIGQSNLPTVAVDEGFVTFAPRIESTSTATFQLPRSKADTKGLGYEESVGEFGFLRSDTAKSQQANRYHVNNLFQKPASSSSSNSKRKTAFLDEDDDIAFDDGDDDVSNYNTMEVDDTIAEDRNKPDKHSLAKAAPSAYERCPSDNRPPLSGFHLASGSGKIVIGTAYPPPVVPKDFKAYHIFSTPTEEKPSTTQSRDNRRSRFAAMDVLAQRQEGLSDEKGQDKSVFSLLRSEDRQRIQALAASINPAQSISSLVPQDSASSQSNDTAKPETTTTEVSNERPLLVSSTLLQSKFASLSQSFKNRFTSASSSSSAAAGLDNNAQGGITSAESLTTMLNKKAAEAALESLVKTEQGVAKKSGGVRRTTVVWSPSSLLCKRCNVKPPDHVTAYRLPNSAAGPSTNHPSINNSSSSKGNEDVMQNMFLTPTTIPPQNAEAAQTTIISTELQKQFEAQDVYNVAPVPPPMDVFRSIFADSDSEDDNDEEEEENEGGNDRNNHLEAVTKSASSALQAQERALSITPATGIRAAPVEQLNNKPNTPSSSTGDSGTKVSESAMDRPNDLPTFIPKSKRNTAVTLSNKIIKSSATSQARVIAPAILTTEDYDEDLPDPTPASDAQGPLQVKQTKRLLLPSFNDEEEEEDSDQRKSLKRKKMAVVELAAKKKRVKLSFGGGDDEDD